MIEKGKDMITIFGNSLLKSNHFFVLWIQSIIEIAEELKISHKTVENQLTNALKFIRTNLKRESIPAILFFVLFIS